MGKFSLGNPKNINRRKVLNYCAIILIATVLLTQMERLVHKGTFFGYVVRDSGSKAARIRKNSSGSFPDAEASAKNSKSIACEKYPDTKVKVVLGADVERIAGFVPDRTKPMVISSCIYKNKTKDGGHTVAILFREFQDESTAAKTVEALKKGNGVTSVAGLGDAAVYNSSANQLTVQSGKKVVTVTVTTTSEKSDNNKDLAIAIAKIGL